MMKSIAKLVLAATIASMAVSMSVTPSLAKKKAAAPKACAPFSWCATKCSGNVCAGGMWCGSDGKWVPGVTGCVEPFCTPKC